MVHLYLLYLKTILRKTFIYFSRLVISYFFNKFLSPYFMRIPIYFRHKGKVRRANKMVNGTIHKQCKIVISLKNGTSCCDEVCDSLRYSDLIFFGDLFIENDSFEEVHQILQVLYFIIVLAQQCLIFLL